MFLTHFDHGYDPDDCNPCENGSQDKQVPFFLFLMQISDWHGSFLIDYYKKEKGKKIEDGISEHTHRRRVLFVEKNSYTA